MEIFIREVQELRVRLEEGRAEEKSRLVLKGKGIEALPKVKTAPRNGDGLDRPVGTSHLHVTPIEVVDQVQIV
jgi:hypothetical protein